jgi:multidrug efflux pump subunit AcrB
MSSIVVLYFTGHTLNTMTLGDMALAVRILVDELLEPQPLSSKS